MFSPEVVALLGKRVTGVITTLLADGSPHSVIAGIIIDGDDLVSHTGPAARRLQNLRRDPRVNVLAIDPDTPMRYAEFRGTATIEEVPGAELAGAFREHAEKYDLPEEASRVAPDATVVKIRITPYKVGYHDLDPSRMGPERLQRAPETTRQAAVPRANLTLDGEVVQDGADYWIQFTRRYDHDPEAVFDALTNPRRLALWQHPVEYFPRLETGATIYARLNIEAGAVALGKVTALEPPRAFEFRWTTNNPMLPPEFTLAFAIDEDRAVRARLGPFTPAHNILGLLASTHIHLDHLEQAITTTEDDLPSPPWPVKSVVTRSGAMISVARAYAAKLAAAHPELPSTMPIRDHMRRPQAG
jgi:PPOX class probable F420-dependent enzyme